MVTFGTTNTGLSKLTLINTNFLVSVAGSVYILSGMTEFQVINCIFDGSINGSAVYIQSLSVVQFKNTTFSNNSAGSVYFTHIRKRAVSIVLDCKFINNTSENGHSGSGIMS